MKLRRKKTSGYKKRSRRRARRRYARRRGFRPDFSTWLRVPGFPIENNVLVVERGVLQWALSDVHSYTTYQAMFDQYKINKVVVRFIPRSTETVTRDYNANQQGPPNLTANFVCALQRDDDGLPNSYEAVRRLQGSRERKMTRGMKWVFRPSLLTQLGPAANSGYSLAGSRWINTKYPGILHYGLAWAIDSGSTTGVFAHDVQAMLHISFRRRKGL